MRILMIFMIIVLGGVTEDSKAELPPIQVRNIDFEVVKLDQGCCPPLKLICSAEIVNTGSEHLSSIKYMVNFPWYAGTGEIPGLNPGQSVTIRKELEGVKGCNSGNTNSSYRCNIKVYYPYLVEAKSSNSYDMPPLRSLYPVTIDALSLTPSYVRHGGRVRYNVTITNHGSSPIPACLKLRIVEPAARDCKGTVARDLINVGLPVGRKDFSVRACPNVFGQPQGNWNGVCAELYCGYEKLTSLWKPLCEVPDRPGYYQLGSLFCGSLNELTISGQKPRKLKEADGKSPGPHSMKESLLDLSVSDIRIVSNCKIQATIRNTGRATLTERAYMALVKMFNDNRAWGEMILKRLDPRRRLKNPGGSITFVWLPSAKHLRLSPGRHRLKLVVDYRNILKESNERNNVMVREVTCR